MRAILIPVALIAALATGTTVEPVQAKGCIKGAIVGGIAGHAAGHGILGAAGGCAVGRHMANSRARRLQSQQQSTPSSGTMQQNQTPSYNNGSMSNGSMNNGTMPQNGAPPYNNGTMQQNQ